MMNNLLQEIAYENSFTLIKYIYDTFYDYVLEKDEESTLYLPDKNEKIVFEKDTYENMMEEGIHVYELRYYIQDIDRSAIIDIYPNKMEHLIVKFNIGDDNINGDSIPQFFIENIGNISQYLYTRLDNVEISIADKYYLVIKGNPIIYKSSKGFEYDYVGESRYERFIIELRFDVIDRELYEPPTESHAGGSLYKQTMAKTKIGKKL